MDNDISKLTHYVAKQPSQCIKKLVNTNDRLKLSKHVCRKSHNQLKSTTISEFKSDGFQHGCILHVNIMDKMIKNSDDLLAIVKEKKTNKIFVLLLLHSVHYKHQLTHKNQTNPTLIIKDPFFKNIAFGKERVSAVMIDNIYCNLCLQYPQTLHNNNDDIRALKQKGNEYFSRKQYRFAIHCYSVALQHRNSENDTMLKFKLLCNRSLCFMHVHHYQNASLDAHNALSIDADSFKAKFRSISALKGIGQYLQALKLLQSIDKTQIKSSGIQTNFDLLQKDILTRYRESMGILQNDCKERIDFALYPPFAHDTQWRKTSDFVGALSIQWINNKKGRGIVATKDIKSGDVVLIEKVFAKGKYTNNQCSKRDVLVMNIVQKIYPHLQMDGFECNPSLLNAKRIQCLYNGGCYDDDTSNKWVPQMDLFKYNMDSKDIKDFGLCSAHDIGRVIDANCYESLCDPNDIDLIEAKYTNKSANKSIEKKMYVGLWLLTSFVNHSDEPNVYRIIWYNTMVIIANRDIKKGEEICLSYLNPFMSDHDRKNQLNEGWGI
eukprot:188002_1